MKLLSCILFLFFSFPLFAQNADSSTTLALFIGISDYKYLEDLDYGAEDAEKMFNFFSSHYEFSFSEENIRLLTNENANIDTIGKSINWLNQESKESKEIKKVIIYFSGHGDVQTDLVNEPGYLLTYETQKGNYQWGKAIDIRQLQDNLSTLASSGVKVIFISDACRSGTAGGSEDGANKTATKLAGKFF